MCEYSQETLRSGMLENSGIGPITAKGFLGLRQDPRHRKKGVYPQLSVRQKEREVSLRYANVMTGIERPLLFPRVNA